VAEALAQVPVGTVFARSVGKEPLINYVTTKKRHALIYPVAVR